jgi:hypothetical protein
MVVVKDSTVAAFPVGQQFAFLHAASTVKLQRAEVIAQQQAALVKVVLEKTVLTFAPEQQPVNNLQKCNYEAEITFL